MQLALRRANDSRKGGPWQHEDFDVFDGGRVVDRVDLDEPRAGRESWFWASRSN